MKKLLAIVVFGIGILFCSNANALLPTHQCIDCHGVHQAPTPNVQLRWYDDISQGCLSCHDGSGAVEVATHIGLECTACHEVHDNLPNYLGGTNIKMVGGQYPAGGDNEASVEDVKEGTGYWKVAYESDIGDRAFANWSTADGGKRICEVCHTIRSGGGMGLHSDPTRTDRGTCKQCHTHANGWLRN